MSLTFTLSLPCDQEGRFDVVITNVAGARILDILGYSATDPRTGHAPTPNQPASANAEDFALRTARARTVESTYATDETAYLSECFTQLERLTKHATAGRHLILWYHGWSGEYRSRT